jgi:hypothetical protein
VPFLLKFFGKWQNFWGKAKFMWKVAKFKGFFLQNFELLQKF